MKPHGWKGQMMKWTRTRLPELLSLKLELKLKWTPVVSEMVQRCWKPQGGVGWTPH